MSAGAPPRSPDALRRKEGIGVPPTVVNAALDALRPLGVHHVDMPHTPERVWQAIHLAEEGRIHGYSRR